MGFPVSFCNLATFGMRIVAFFLMILFATFTVVLSTSYLWQKGKNAPIVLVEEEEDHSSETCNVQDLLLTDFHPDLSLIFDYQEPSEHSLHIDPSYEDVFLIAPFSPPDVA